MLMLGIPGMSSSVASPSPPRDADAQATQGTVGQNRGILGPRWSIARVSGERCSCWDGRCPMLNGQSLTRDGDPSLVDANAN